MNLFKRQKKEEQEPLEKVELSGLIDATPIEAIYPFVYKETKDYVEMGGNYLKIIAFASYPNEQKGNWLSDLKRMKGNITISQYIEQTDVSIMLDHYNSSYKNKEAELLKTHDPQYRIKLKKEMKSAAYQLEEALNNKSGYVNIYTYILIQAQEQEELTSLEEKIQRILMKLHIKGIVPYYKMTDAYWSALPLMQNLLKEYTYQMSNTTAASSFFPFDDSEICDLSPKAQIEGINKKTNSLVAINYLNDKLTLNQNMFVIGTSGVGKTTYLQRKIINLIAQGRKIYIIDPENEYTKIVTYFGGTVIHLSSRSDTIINPLEIYSEELTDDELIKNVTHENKIKNLVKQKCQRLKGFFKVIKSDMTQVEASIIESLVLKLYGKLETCKDLKTVKHEDFPILEDLYKACDLIKTYNPEKFSIIRDFYYILESYVYGSNSLFNGATNINLSSDIVSFDLSALQTEKDVQGACYLNIFSYLWDDITKVKTGEFQVDNDYAAYMFIDEFHFLLKNQESCDFFFQAYKRFRKYKAGAIAATQQINDVLKANYSEGDLGTAVVENSYTKVFFRLDNKGVDELIDKLKLSFSKPEISLLRAKRQGEALIIHGTKRVFMKIELTKEELGNNIVLFENDSELESLKKESPAFFALKEVTHENKKCILNYEIEEGYQSFFEAKGYSKVIRLSLLERVLELDPLSNYPEKVLLHPRNIYFKDLKTIKFLYRSNQFLPSVKNSAVLDQYKLLILSMLSHYSYEQFSIKKNELLEKEKDIFLDIIENAATIPELKGLIRKKLFQDETNFFKNLEEDKLKNKVSKTQSRFIAGGVIGLVIAIAVIVSMVQIRNYGLVADQQLKNATTMGQAYELLANGETDKGLATLKGTNPSDQKLAQAYFISKQYDNAINTDSDYAKIVVSKL